MSAKALVPEQRAWRARVFSATWLSYFGFYFCRKPFYVVKADLGEAFGWDAQALGYIGTAYLLAYAVGQFVSGFLGDRTGARVLLLTGMMVSLLANAAFGFSNSLGMFMAFMVLNGLAQASGWSGNVGTMAAWTTRTERGTLMGIWGTCYQFGGVAAKAAAAFMLGWMGFRYAFWGGSLVLLAAWVWFVFNQRNTPEDVGLEAIDPPDSDAVAVTDEDGKWPRKVIINVLLIGSFYFFVKFIRYALWSWAPYLLQTNYGLAGDEAGYLSTVFDMAGIGGVLAAGWLSDRYFKGRRVTISFIFIIGMAISCVVLVTLGKASLLFFAIGMGMIGFTLYGPDALMTGPAAIEVGSIKRAVLAAGIINGMGSIGSVAQELLLPQLMGEDGGVGSVFWALLGSSVMAALLLTTLLWRNHTGEADL